MTAFPAIFYGDPAIVLEQKQQAELNRKARSCEGCVHSGNAWGLMYCERNKSKPAVRYMRRCKNYEKGTE